MKRSLPALTASATTLFLAAPASAQQGIEKFTNLATVAATTIQALCVIACVAFIAMAGVAMGRGDPSANEKVGSAVKGTVIAVGAGIIVTIVKELLL